VTSSRALLAQGRTELAMTLRRGESVIVTLMIPAGVLLLFSRVESTIPDGYDEAVDFLLPGVLALAVIAAATVSLGIATGFERRYGVLKRLGSTPLSRGGLIGAKTATVLVLEVIQLVVLVAVARALGWELRTGLIAAVPILALGTIAFAGLGLLMAGTLRAEATLAGANALFFVFLALGGIAYPLERLPAFLETVARALPAAALSESLRGVLVSSQGFAGGAFAVLVAWAIALPALAIRHFRWEE
jgi:ABC-2 type transport system permease protein